MINLAISDQYIMNIVLFDRALEMLTTCDNSFRNCITCKNLWLKHIMEHNNGKFLLYIEPLFLQIINSQFWWKKIR